MGSEPEERIMKVRYALAALACIAVAMPSLASAETTVIKKGGEGLGARAELRGDFHRHHFDRDRDRDHKVVIIKHRHDRRMD
jgi:hypothetical protein